MKMMIVVSLMAMLAAPITAFAQKADPQEIKVIATANNAFAFNLYQKLSGEGGNLFFSPYGIDTALAMAYAGARGQTAQQMAGVLHFSLPVDKLNEAYADMIGDLNASGQRGDQVLYKLVVANAMWGQRGFPFDAKYEELLRKNYGAGLMTADFQNATEQARQAINDWVDKQTSGKIRDLIGPGVLDPLTRLVLTNAIYFKSNWDSEFTKAATKDEPWLQANQDKTRLVPLMSQQKRFGYFENDQLQGLELPYRGNALTMLVLLPKKLDGLADVEKTLSPEVLNKWLEGSQTRLVRVYLPKFKIESQFSLAKVLQTMGMTDAFRNSADFSGIATAEKLCISDVIHKAYVDVNEEGTEAAAATAVIMRPTAARPQPEEPVTFRADHPFIFAIRHRQTGAVLFLGRVVDPK